MERISGETVSGHALATDLRFARADLLDVLTGYGHTAGQRRRLHAVADAIQRAIDRLDGRFTTEGQRAQR